MSDVLERLNYRPSSLAANERLLDDCKAEIERLRGDYSHLEECNKINMAEVERIRAATIEECAQPLEQIRQVCADNAGEGSNHKMALDFVHQIAIRALKEWK